MKDGLPVSAQVSGFNFKVRPLALFSEKLVLSIVRRKSNAGSSCFSKAMV